MDFKYERGEGRTKHCWNQDEAGFQPSPRGPVGKCHNSITDTVAEELLNSGIPEITIDEEDSTFPKKIFNVYRGVPYEAVPTQPGISYHGYPWKGRMSRTTREALQKRAAAEGDEKVFRRWMSDHS